MSTVSSLLALPHPASRATVAHPHCTCGRANSWGEEDQNDLRLLKPDLQVSTACPLMQCAATRAWSRHSRGQCSLTYHTAQDWLVFHLRGHTVDEVPGLVEASTLSVAM
eukprot:1941262-Rhodomonas_salina.1